MITTVRPHNEKAAAAWGSGGAVYDRVSETIADALDHVVARVAPQPGEKCLDVATGTGWTARRLKARGASVTGVDIGAGVIEAAKKLAPDIDFRVGDAEELAFPVGSFDVVTSTFGVMFVARPEDAARELARVQERWTARDRHVATGRYGRRALQSDAPLYATTIGHPITVRVGQAGACA